MTESSARGLSPTGAGELAGASDGALSEAGAGWLSGAEVGSAAGAAVRLRTGAGGLVVAGSLIAVVAGSLVTTIGLSDAGELSGAGEPVWPKASAPGLLVQLHDDPPMVLGVVAHRYGGPDLHVGALLRGRERHPRRDFERLPLARLNAESEAATSDRAERALINDRHNHGRRLPVERPEVAKCLFGVRWPL